MIELAISRCGERCSSLGSHGLGADDPDHRHQVVAASPGRSHRPYGGVLIDPPSLAAPTPAVAVEVLSHGGFPQLSGVCGCVGAEAIATVGRCAEVRLW